MVVVVVVVVVLGRGGGEGIVNRVAYNRDFTELNKRDVFSSCLVCFVCCVLGLP